MHGNEMAIKIQSRQQHCNGQRQFALALQKKIERPGQQNHCTGRQHKQRRNRAQVLAHANAHCGAGPSGDGVEPSSYAATLCY